MHNSFNKKWSDINTSSEIADEHSLFVAKDTEPETQRQLTLYYCFLFIKNILKKYGPDVKDVLETGCGRGTMGLYLATHLRTNVFLLDNSKDAIEIAQNEFARYKQKGSFSVGDSLNSPFEDNSFDSIVSIGLVEHFTPNNVNIFFQEQHRLLRTGGVLISLNIPQKFSIQFLNTVMRYLKKIYGSYTDEIHKDYFRNSLKPPQYKMLARNAGFKNISTTRVLPFPLFTPITIPTDKKITQLYKKFLKIRSMFQEYPYKASPLVSRAHFLVAYK